MKDLLLKFNRHKTILIGVFIGLVAFPTISLGGTFVSSLLQGKSVEESIQILGNQIDSLIGRVGILEEQERLNACNFADSALANAQIQGGIIAWYKNFDELIDKIIEQRDYKGYGGKGGEIEILPEGYYQTWQTRLEKVQSLKEQYLIAKDKCDSVESQK